MEYWETEEWLRQKYVSEHLTMAEIAEQCEGSKKQIFTRINNHNINRNPKHRDEDWLRQKYVEEELSCSEMAELCDASRSAIHKNLKKNNIERRDQGTKDFGSEVYHQKEWFEQKYYDEELTYKEIADICGVSEQTIYNTSKKLGIDTEGDTRYRDRDWFHNQYIELDKTLDDVASMCDISRNCAIEWRKKHNIPVQYPTGENHPDTKPNEECVTREKGQDWHRQRRLALERADHACENPDCNENIDTLGQNPDVHHIVPYRFHEEYDDINDLTNLVVLCRSCHSEAEPAKITKLAFNALDDDESVIDFAVNARPGVS